MKKLKVFLNYPWKFPDSPYYKYLLESPPKNVEYIANKSQFDVIISKNFGFLTGAKKVFRYLLGIRRYPNVRKDPLDGDVVHCAHCLIKTERPWIVDIENYWNFAPSYFIAHSKKGKRIIKKYLNQDSCKKILAWTEAAKKSVVDALGDKEIEKKIEVVYPAIPFPVYKKKKHNKIVLLFVGRYFYSKGGVQTLEVFDQLTKEFDNVEAIFVSQTPKEFIEKYSNNHKIKFYSLMSKEKLFREIFPESDIFVYPGFSDTFGFAMVEAMAFGLPIVSAKRFAREEIVDDGKTGFLIDVPNLKYKLPKARNIQDGIPLIKGEQFMRDFKMQVRKLIVDEKLRKKMSSASKREVKSGKFSMKERDMKLKRIFENIRF